MVESPAVRMLMRWNVLLVAFKITLHTLIKRSPEVFISWAAFSTIMSNSTRLKKHNNVYPCIFLHVNILQTSSAASDSLRNVEYNFSLP